MHKYIPLKASQLVVSRKHWRLQLRLLFCRNQEREDGEQWGELEPAGKSLVRTAIEPGVDGGGGFEVGDD
jgi:hypothetical protein